MKQLKQLDAASKSDIEKMASSLWYLAKFKKNLGDLDSAEQLCTRLIALETFEKREAIELLSEIQRSRR